MAINSFSGVQAWLEKFVSFRPVTAPSGDLPAKPCEAKPCGGDRPAQARVQAKLHVEPGKLLDILPDGAGGQQLHLFWTTFAALNLRPLQSGRKWTREDLKTFEQVRLRCLDFTYPFTVALALLLDGPAWRKLKRVAVGDRRAREAAVAEQMAEQWRALLVVQRLLGRLDSASSPAWQPSSSLSSQEKMKREITDRQEKYIAQARIFQVVAGMLSHGGANKAPGPHGGQAEVDRSCNNAVQMLLAVQHILPDGWRAFH